MKELHPNEGLKIFDIKWQVQTAGPSPNNNERIEVFLLGCDKAMNGNPCEGCFNSVTWDKSIAQCSRDPIEIADMINKGCNPDNKYITIGGGEPTDQLNALIPFVKRLKEHDFHILMYTWKELKSIAYDKSYKELLRYVDIIVDGEYKAEESLLAFNSKNTARNFVGSGNQIVWEISPVVYGFALKDINNLSLCKEDLYGAKNVLYYDVRENAVMQTLD